MMPDEWRRASPVTENAATHHGLPFIFFVCLCRWGFSVLCAMLIHIHKTPGTRESYSCTIKPFAQFRCVRVACVCVCISAPQLRRLCICVSEASFAYASVEYERYSSIRYISTSWIFRLFILYCSELYKISLSIFWVRVCYVRETSKTEPKVVERFSSTIEDKLDSCILGPSWFCSGVMRNEQKLAQSRIELSNALRANNTTTPTISSNIRSVLSFKWALRL